MKLNATLIRYQNDTQLNSLDNSEAGDQGDSPAKRHRNRKDSYRTKVFNWVKKAVGKMRDLVINSNMKKCKSTKKRLKLHTLAFKFFCEKFDIERHINRKGFHDFIVSITN